MPGKQRRATRSIARKAACGFADQIQLLVFKILRSGCPEGTLFEHENASLRDSRYAEKIDTIVWTLK